MKKVYFALIPALFILFAVAPAQAQDSYASVDNGSVVLEESATPIFEVVDGKMLDDNLLDVSPNPAIDKMEVKFKLLKANKISIQLLDFDGNVVSNIKRNKSHAAGFHSFELDTKKFANGVYVLQITGPNFFMSRSVGVFPNE